MQIEMCIEYKITPKHKHAQSFACVQIGGKLKEYQLKQNRHKSSVLNLLHYAHKNFSWLEDFRVQKEDYEKQISVLLKQVQEATLLNETLSSNSVNMRKEWEKTQELATNLHTELETVGIPFHLNDENDKKVSMHFNLCASGLSLTFTFKCL